MSELDRQNRGPQCDDFGVGDASPLLSVHGDLIFETDGDRRCQRLLLSLRARKLLEQGGC
jgi:hypothetical protein